MHLCTLLLIPQLVSLQRCLFKERIGIVFWMLLLIPAFQLVLADDPPSGVNGSTPMLLQKAEETEDMALTKDLGFIDYTEIETRNFKKSDDPKFVILGDMVFEEDEYKRKFQSTVYHSARNFDLSLWPRVSGRPLVPYDISNLNEMEREMFVNATDHWREHTCIRFRPNEVIDRGYIKLVKGEGCKSPVGFLGKKPQFITLDSDCLNQGTLVHMIGHTLGFLHEQSRLDRNRKIRIVEKNINEDMMMNFFKDKDSYFINFSWDYDYTSVMQLGSFSFSKNGGLTLRTLDPKFQGLIGRNRMLTYRDIAAANQIYGCLDDWLSKCKIKKGTCLNEGYIGPKCKCVCEPGTEGELCEKVVGNYYDNLLPKCSSNITQNQTTLKSPNYPNEKPDTWCVYQIKAPENHTIEVEFRDFQLHAVGGKKELRCRPSFLALMEDKAPDSDDTILCGTDKKNGDVFKTTTNELVMYFDIGQMNHPPKMIGFHLFIRFLPHKALPTTANNLIHLTTTVATLTSGINTSRNDLKPLTTTVATLTSSKSTSENYFKHLTTTVATLTSGIITSRNDLKPLTTTVATLTSSKSTSENYFKNLTTTVATLTSGIITSRNDLRPLTTTVATLTSSKSKSENYFKHLSTTVATLTSGSNTSGNDLKQLTTTVATLTSGNNTSGNDTHLHNGVGKRSNTIIVNFCMLFWLMKDILVV